MKSINIIRGEENHRRNWISKGELIMEVIIVPAAAVTVTLAPIRSVPKTMIEVYVVKIERKPFLTLLPHTALQFILIPFKSDIDVTANTRKPTIPRAPALLTKPSREEKISSCRVGINCCIRKVFICSLTLVNAPKAAEILKTVAVKGTRARRDEKAREAERIWQESSKNSRTVNKIALPAFDIFMVKKCTRKKRLRPAMTGASERRSERSMLSWPTALMVLCLY